jgi:hypothetical protein
VLPLTEKTIRSSFVNASRKEVADMSMPADFDQIDWGALDYLGWRDRKIARRAYVVIVVGDVPVAILLKQAEASPRSRAQCSWCQDVELRNDVVFYSARRAGAAGRNGDTVGTLICAEFGCSANVRRTPALAYVGFDVNAARAERMRNLQNRVAAFARTFQPAA